MDADADAGGQVDGGPSPDSGAESPELSIERERVVRTADDQMAGLTSANQVLHLFVKQNPTLGLELDACGNGEAVAARVESASVSQGGESCVEVALSCEGAQASVEATFDGCIAGESGAMVTGQVTATVGRVEVDGEPLITVTLALNDVTAIYDDRSYLLSGQVETRTSDLITYGLSADLTSNGYALTFDGTAAAQENGEGELRALTLDGGGTLAGPSMGETFGSWSCTASGLAYTLAGFHVVAGECHADAGVLELEERYTCTSSVSMRGGSRMLSSTADVEDLITWDSDTPTSGLVHVVTSTTVAGQTTTTNEMDVALPGTCM